MKTIEEEFPENAELGLFALADAYTRLRARAVEMERALAASTVEQDPFQSEDYQRFQAEMAKTCGADDAPCASCLAGGICDGPSEPRHCFDEQDDMDRDSY